MNLHSLIYEHKLVIESLESDLANDVENVIIGASYATMEEVPHRENAEIVMSTLGNGKTQSYKLLVISYFISKENKDQH